MAHWENHKRNSSHRKRPEKHKYPGNVGEAGKTDEKTLRWLLNQVIQEFGRTGEMNHGMFHTILQRFFDSWRLLADKLQQVSCYVFSNRICAWRRISQAAARRNRRRPGLTKPGRDGGFKR
jgi:hypothetical protein